MSEHPIRLLVTDDLRRSRLTVALRLLFAIPHFIWLGLWSLLAIAAAFANWVGTLLLGRPPALLHRFLSAYVKYATQFYAYLRLAAEPYPSFDGPDGYPVDLSMPGPERQRRLSVLFRLPLAIPAFLLASALGGSGSLASRQSNNTISITGNGLGGLISVFGWFASLARRNMPRGLRDTAAWSVGYGAQTWAYLLLLTDRYPDSDPLALLPEVPEREDPLHVRCEDDLRRSRLTVLFRLPLSFPHLVWLFLWLILALPCALASWLATLVRGTPPAALHRFLSRYVRYEVSVWAFLHVVSNPFPGFAGAPGAYPQLETEIAAPARQNRWKVAFRALLWLPAGTLASAYSSLLLLIGVLAWFSALVRGRVPRGLRTAGTVALRYQAAATGYLLLLTDTYPYTGPIASDAPSQAAPRKQPPSPTPPTPSPPSAPATAPSPPPSTAPPADPLGG